MTTAIKQYSRRSKVPNRVSVYVRECHPGLIGVHPTIREVWYPGRGWRRHPNRTPKYISVSEVRRLKLAGATAISLQFGSFNGYPSFQIDEILRFESIIPEPHTYGYEHSDTDFLADEEPEDPTTVETTETPDLAQERVREARAEQRIAQIEWERGR
jgi:hypothetical protein